jgi:hypothetical protein
MRAAIRNLRLDLQRLAHEAKGDLVRRYALRLPPQERLSLYRRFRIAVGLALRRIGLRRSRQLEPWLPALKHFRCGDDARPLLIWALKTDRDTLRAACEGFTALQAKLPGFVPVLVTDVADFAFFSRLGWLVEYVPAFSAPAGGYAGRKLQYLAWRYKDAPALPVSVGLAINVRIEELLLD